MLKRAKYVLGNEEADLNLQAIILIAVGLIVAAVVILFGDTIRDFFQNAVNKTLEVNNKVNNEFNTNP